MSTDKIKTEVERAPSFYSILFQFPSFGRLIFVALSASIILGVLSELILPPFNLFSDFYFGVMEGVVVFFVPSVLSAFIGLLILRKSTPMLNLRRLVATSTVETIVWGFFYVTGLIIYLFFPVSAIAVNGFCLGAAFTLTVRLLIFFSISFSGPIGNLALSLVRPVLGVGFVFLSYSSPLNLLLTGSMDWLPALAGASLIMGAGVFVYKYIVDLQLKRKVGISSTVFLKAFMASWLEDRNSYLEDLFERLGDDGEVEVGLVFFKIRVGGKIVFIVPTIHPGPFRTVGSSNIPQRISSVLEGRGVSAAAVFHGPSNHSTNLTRADYCNTVTELIEKNIEGCSSFFDGISRFVRRGSDRFDVGCQFFGGLALLTAFDKMDTEDIAPSVLDELRDRAKGIGVDDVVLIDAHNNKIVGSKRQPIKEPEEVDKLLGLCLETIKEARSLDKEAFLVGANRFTFNSDLKARGIGDSGILTIILKTQTQKMVYVLVDGNNMVAGLRDKIRSSVLSLGYDECEVMTTDTHSVDGVTLKSSNMVGLNYPEGDIIEKAVMSVGEAEKYLSKADGCYNIFRITGVRTAGEAVETILKGTGKAINSARTSLPPILASSLILSIILFFLL